ncbi:unnamed protein product [Dimorphilus gyrociliatus]|uniref:Uncharacterized protein n=1 Tax=Dimorphilus gyrociliatus TaxID=2664684 RepID=A0A7I8VYM2_9ANNE|nr:unnamed protein product [Dimorphilus gyrociliatus]
MGRFTEMYQDEAKAVDKSRALYIIIYRVLLGIPPFFLGFVCGAWSDKMIGRKLPMIISCLGNFIGAYAIMLDPFVNLPLPMVLAFCGVALTGVLGQTFLMTMACYSYAADVTTSEKRTKKFDMLQAMQYVGSLIGSLIPVFISAKWGSDFMFNIVMALSTLGIMIAIFLADETVDTKGLTESSKHYLVSFETVKDTVKSLIRNRSSYSRCMLIIFFFSKLIFVMGIASTGDLVQQFTSRKPMLWTLKEYCKWLSIYYGSMGLSAIFILPIVQYFFKLSDMCVVVIGLFIKTIQMICMWLFMTDWRILFAVTAVGSLSATVASTLKSAISKLVDEDEVGKVFSLLTCCEVASSMLGQSILQMVYRETIKSSPELVFLLIGAIFGGNFIVSLLLWFFVGSKKNLEKSFNREETESLIRPSDSPK